MVAPYQVGDLVRSFVRVPGSGLQTKSTKHTFCNSVSMLTEVQKLKEKNELLRKENEKLKKQVSLFKKLVLNPQRVNSVLTCLKEKFQEA